MITIYGLTFLGVSCGVAIGRWSVRGLPTRRMLRDQRDLAMAQITVDRSQMAIHELERQIRDRDAKLTLLRPS